tara:strand:+ start:709 stop:1485 length:777 start_codon:yes stop_codon:yes gene_type:complete
MQYIDDVYDMGEDAFDTGISPEFLGGVGGIIAGATISGLLVSSLSFSSTIGQIASSGGIFLVGAGLYGYGLSGRVANAAIRSATQITGVVVGGVGLGRLLSSIGAPSLGLGAETGVTIGRMGLPLPDDGRVTGQDYMGRTLGQAAEDDELDRSNQDWKENWNGIQNAEAGAATVEKSNPEAYSPKLELPSAPKWSMGGLNKVANPWEAAEKWDIMTPSSPMNGVPEWFGSAEEFRHSSKTTTIGNLFGVAGMGSIIGQ